MEDRFGFQPVVIIGAARSGTNMLRDMLARMRGVGTWPCDEINYIWKHHNIRTPHDELGADAANPGATRYIRDAFADMGKKSRCQWLVEKTCANSLRVNFVDAVVPEAKYLFIVRDGRDVVSSALKRWKASLDVGYVLKKVPFVPAMDMPYYALRYATHRLHRYVSRERRLASWGPRFIGMQEMLAERPLVEVCAAQWQRSVVAANEALGRLAEDRVHVLHYEDMVTDPQAVFAGVLEFLGVPADSRAVAEASGTVFSGSAGAWRKSMSQEQRETIETLLGATLETFGYGVATDVQRRAA